MTQGPRNPAPGNEPVENPGREYEPKDDPNRIPPDGNPHGGDKEKDPKSPSQKRIQDHH